MKKILTSLVILLTCSFAYSQNGLENIIVEKYYVSNAADAAGSIGALPVGSVTYRIYVDMLPGYKFQAAYGVAGHQLKIATTTAFFNNEDRGAPAPTFNKTNAASNTVMLDSWLSVGAACSANYGILKSEDNSAGGVNVVNSSNPQILQNNDPLAGIPLTTQDGFYTGFPNAVTFVGINSGVPNELDVFDNVSNAGNLFTTSNGSWASLGGTLGPIAATNKVLIAQLTTNGCLSFELNIQIGTPTGGAENYVARNPVGNEIKFPGLLYNVADVSITSNPSGPICTGTNVTFTASIVNGGLNPVYQWKKNGVVVGTNSPTYSNNALSNNAQVKCVLTSNLACVATSVVTSNTITVPVGSYPNAVVSASGPTTFCTGANALTLNASTGTGYTYKWKKFSTYINGATGSSYIPTTSSTYKVEITNASGCSKVSNGIVVTVLPAPSASVTATGPLTFCSGTNALTLTANSGTGLSYQWLKGTVAISGATGISYNPSTSATYKVIVTNSNGCTKSSSGVVVTVKSLPSATVTAQGPTTFCAGDSVKLSANTGSGLTYQWVKGTANISGATAVNYTAKTAGSYKVIVTNTNTCSKTSTGKTVTVNCREGEIATGSITGKLLVFPNPANGPFQISFESDQIIDGQAVISIVNVLGQTIFSSRADIKDGHLNREVETESLSKGMYFVRLITSDQSFDTRIIIE